MTLLMDVLPEQLGEWTDILSGQSYVWQAGKLVQGQLDTPQGHLVLLAKQLTKSALSQSLQVLDGAGVSVEIASFKRIAEREVLNLRLSAWSPELKAHLQDIASSWDIVKALAGADAAIIDQVIANMPLMPGLLTLVAGLKAMGWKVALASGGFTPFTGHLRQTLGLDADFANTLEIKDGRFTGAVLGDIVDAEAKARILCELAAHYDIPLSQTVAVGDGANDLLMLAQAGLGVALHAKPLVQEQAPVCLNLLSLEGVLGLVQTA